MLDAEQILSNVDLGPEAPSAETVTEQTADSTAATESTETTTDEGQVAESVDESQGTEQTSEKAPEPPAKEPGKAKDAVPLALHLETKHKLREAKLELAELRARQMIAAQQQTAKSAEAPKSPMEQFVAEQGGNAVPTAQVLMDQRAWDKQQAEQQQVAKDTTVASESVAVALQTMTDEQMGEGLGFETVLHIGHKYLTAGDVLDIQQGGAAAGKLMYDRCLERAIRSGKPEGKLLAAALRQVHAKVVPSTNKTPKQPKEAPTREQILSPAGGLAGFFLSE